MEDLKTHTKDKVSKPKLYKVMLLNDDFTPVEFVIDILIRVFNKGSEEAIELTYETHNKGRAIAGIYTLEVAETKAMIAEERARSKGHPFKLGLQPE